MDDNLAFALVCGLFVCTAMLVLLLGAMWAGHR